MSRSRHPDIRALLRNNEDGLTPDHISGLLDISPNNVRQALRNMPDAFIDRWDGPTRGQYVGVWCVVVPPANCPHPTDA